MRGLVTAYRVKTFAWHGLDQLVVTGVPKLILLPLLAALVGPAEFGVFVLALSVVQSIGLSPSNGFQGWILRSLEEYPQKLWDELAARAALWGFVAALPFAVGALSAPLWADKVFAASGVAPVLVAFAPFLIATNCLETALARERVRRRFGSLVRWHSFHLVGVLLGVILSWDGSPDRVAWGVSMGSSLTALIMVALLARRARPVPPAVAEQARIQALTVWWPLSLAALLSLSAYSVDRVVVGIWLDADAVAVYFAAASLASLAVVPFSMMAGWGLTMLGRVGNEMDRVKSDWKRVTPLALAAISTIVLALVFTGSHILHFFYPSLATEAIEIWWVLVVAAGARAAYVIIRPMVIKFANPRILPLLTLASISIKVAALIILVPHFGLLGAAVATLGASVVLTLMWWAVAHGALERATKS